MAATNLGPQGYALKQSMARNINLANVTKEQRTLISVGDANLMKKLFVDGKELDTDQYDKESGSTIITVLTDTLEEIGAGDHTIAVEFREADGSMRTSAQNVTISGSVPTPVPIPVGPSGYSGGSSSGGSATPTPTPTPSPSPAPVSGGPVALEFSTEGDKASVKPISEEKGKELDAAKTADVVVDLSSAGAIVTVSIPASVVEKLAGKMADSDAETGTLTLKMPAGEIVIDEIALAAVMGQNGGNDTAFNAVTITIEELNSAQKAELGDRQIYGGLRVSAKAGDTDITSFDGGRITMTIAFEVPSGKSSRDFSVFHIGEDGRLHRHASRFENGSMEFRAAHFSDFIILEDPVVAFSDVSENAWFCSSVDYVSRSGLMNGVTASQFAPDTKLSRAMLAQILYNIESAPAADTRGSFSDVAEDAWYAKAVNWAAEAGIVSGRNGGIFDPDANISREELAQMLFNYAKYKGYNTGHSAALTRFSDGSAASAWAKDALSWAVGEKLISGYEDGTLNSKASATRAQAAKILTFFMESYTL